MPNIDLEIKTGKQCITLQPRIFAQILPTFYHILVLELRINMTKKGIILSRGRALFFDGMRCNLFVLNIFFVCAILPITTLPD